MSSSKDDCKVFIYGSEIRQGVGARLQFMAPKIMCLQHWSVVLVYRDGNVAVCEGNPDSETGVLTGRLSWRTLKDVDSSMPNKVSLGNHRLPVGRVVSVMRSMNRDTQYTLLKNNCQSWVRELLHRLGIEVPEDTFAFTDTAVGQRLSKVAGLLEDADSDDSNVALHRHHQHHQHQAEADGKSRKHSEGRSSSPNGSQPASPDLSPPGSINGDPSGLRPLAWIGAVGAGAVAAGLAYLGVRFRSRRRNI